MTDARAVAEFDMPEGMTPHERKLWRQRKPRPVDETETRRCLSCQSEFPSKWPGNRICGDCRETEQWKGSGLDEYEVTA